MNNVHRLVVPQRDETRRATAPSAKPMGEVLILPCVRYERIETPGSRRVTSTTIAHEDLLQDLTA